MKTERLDIRLTKEDKDWLKAECKKKFQNYSEFLRMLMDNYRKENVGQK